MSVRQLDARHPNVIINGRPMIDQRAGAGHISTEGSQFATDRHSLRYGNDTGAGAMTRSLSTWADGRQALRAEVTTAQAHSAGVLLFGAHDYVVEGYDYLALRLAADDYMVYRVSLKTNKAGKYSILFRNHDRTRSLWKHINVSGTGGEEVFNVPVPVDSGGSWLYDNGMGIRIALVYSIAPDSILIGGTEGQWNAGDFYGDGTEANLFDTVGNYIEITDVGLYPGTVAPRFIQRPIGDELALCQRYYREEHMSALSTASAASAWASSSHTWNPMRTVPDATVGTPAQASNLAGGGPDIMSLTDRACLFRIRSAGAGTFLAYDTPVTLDAEL